VRTCCAKCATSRRSAPYDAGLGAAHGGVGDSVRNDQPSGRRSNPHDSGDNGTAILLLPGFLDARAGYGPTKWTAIFAARIIPQIRRVSSGIADDPTCLATGRAAPSKAWPH